VKAISKLLLRAAALFVLICLFLVRPLVRVRLCIVAFHRFGHLALEPEIFLGEQELRVKSSVTKRFPVQIHWWSFGPERLQANKFLVSKWCEAVCALPSWWIDALHTVGRVVPFLQLEEPKMSIRGNLNALDQTKAHLQITEAEKRRANSELRGLGVDPDKPYVCLVVRDGGHYASLGEKESDGYSFLNFDVSTFEQSALWLVEHGYQVLRMGAGSETPLITSHPQLIDYANSQHRSEFLDIYIAATCSFAVSTQTGPDAVCLAFRRPVCYIDVSRFSQFFFGTKLAWWNPTELWQTGSRLSLRDVLTGPVGNIKDPNDFIKYGVTQVRSDSSAITKLVACFAESFEKQFVQSESDEVVEHSVQRSVEELMGFDGRQQFGRITAVLNPAFVRQSGDWYLV
jgi:putative glycosyltransferase (TIGR04372 family)